MSYKDPEKQAAREKIDALYDQGDGFDPIKTLSDKKPVEREACPSCKSLSIRECQPLGTHKCNRSQCKEVFGKPTTIIYWGKCTPNGYVRQREEEWMHERGILGEHWDNTLIEFAREIMKAKTPMAYKEVRKSYPGNGRDWPNEDKQLPAHQRPRSRFLYP